MSGAILTSEYKLGFGGESTEMLSDKNSLLLVFGCFLLKDKKKIEEKFQRKALTWSTLNGN